MTAGPATRVFLVGMMGAGKSTTARLLADRLGWACLDTDSQIEADNSRTVPELFGARGEAFFRAEETRVLAAQAAGPAGPAVVSVGGGSVLAEANRRYLREGGVVVWLRAEPPSLLDRLGRGDGRPLLQGDAAAHVARLCAERADAYQSVADIVVDVDGLGPDEVADRVESALSSRLAAPRA